MSGNATEVCTFCGRPIGPGEPGVGRGETAAHAACADAALADEGTWERIAGGLGDSEPPAEAAGDDAGPDAGGADAGRGAGGAGAAGGAAAGRSGCALAAVSLVTLVAFAGLAQLGGRADGNPHG